MRRTVQLGVGALMVAFAAVAGAQTTTQIKPRVMLMVDTSGSMLFHLNDGDSAGGDGSYWFKSGAGLERNQTNSADYGYSLYEGFQTQSGSQCPPTASAKFDGVNSRLYAAKAAINDVINGSGDVDWGLMRYSGSFCAFSSVFAATACGWGNACKGGATCTNNVCPCSTDFDCGYGEFCVGGRCGKDGNLCNTSSNLYTGMTDSRSKSSCANHGGSDDNASVGGIAMTYTGQCGSNASANSATCQAPQVCQKDSDCSGTASGRCKTVPGLGGIKWCQCNQAGMTCGGSYATCGSSNYCLYSNKCTDDSGGVVVVDPSLAGFSSNQVLPWTDGVEIYTDNGSAAPLLDNRITNPELRANGGTPLAGAARAATKWYTSAVASDPKAQCRPYVLVQLTDGQDSCDSDNDKGPVAAASGFVAATIPGAKTPNKVYVIGLAFGNSAGPLDAIAQAGGTGKARLANSQMDIEAALADIVSSSVLVEKCNGIDDNCNGQCDENYPGVAVSGASCTNKHSAAVCDNGFPANVSCHDSGVFVCSADQLGQACSAQTCAGGNRGAITRPVAGTMRIGTTGPFNVPTTAVGQLLWVANAQNAANNGVFTITGVGADYVEVSNPNVVVPDSNVVGYGVPTTQGTASIAVAAGKETLTVASTAGVKAGDTLFVTGAATAAYNGSFVVSSVTSTTIVLAAKAGAPNGSGSAKWLDPRVCPGVEVCNGADDDCDGIVDNCGDSVSGSCCTSACPACAKAPFIETCNNCDDDCDGVVDNHLVDTGLSCGNDVGDCAPGVTVCCKSDPNVAGSCTVDGKTDAIYCQGGNPGYPKPADLCDGTDNNCNGIPNDNPPRACFSDGTSTLPANQDGVGSCHHGVQRCITTPLPAGDPGCPSGWPAGKPCPKAPSAYDPVCQGLVLPQPEACNGLDDDCDGTPDNHLGAPFGQACCDTGNPADCANTTTNGHTGSRCKLGVWTCDSNGEKVCVGSIHKTLEICDMEDNDCNGLVDDVPGVGSPCTGNGVFTGGSCTATLQCVAGNVDPVCTQVNGPQMETCNGLDDNCNGKIDDTEPPLAPAGGVLPGVGLACDLPLPPKDKPPCKPGETVCVAGSIQCVGAVHPIPNQCNGISTDCTGMPNTHGDCPSGYDCVNGNCVAPCGAGEFPCPGGYACNRNTNACDDVKTGAHLGCCVIDACAKANCPPGFLCDLDAMGNAKCIDPCVNVSCPPGYICQLGACVDGSCRSQGCPAGQICVTDANDVSMCVDDPCANVVCQAGQFCQAGQCVNGCKGPCPPGEYCDQGMCTADPCAGLPCVAGQVCRVENGVGVCVDNMCQSGCNLGQACCGGSCIADPCVTLHCPEDTHCSLTSSCTATCETNPAPPKDQVVGAGGGGFGCQVGGGSTPEGGAWLLVALLVLWRRRRQAEVSR